jgi:hypothetical protein
VKIAGESFLLTLLKTKIFLFWQQTVFPTPHQIDALFSMYSHAYDIKRILMPQDYT